MDSLTTMDNIDKCIYNNFNLTRKNARYLCNAPFCAMYFYIGGQVSPCCKSFGLHETYQGNSIEEIWTGNVFNAYRKQIKSRLLPDACYFCRNRLKNKEFHQVTIRQYDDFKIRLLGKKNIQSIQVAFNNTCNLRCVMCNEIYSTQFKKEGTCLNRKVYDKRFIEDLNKYIPKLKEFICLGGEPFLIEEYYEIWNQIIKENPKCEISVITNGTILNDRIKNLIDSGNFKINISFETINKETYESIRRNANFGNVMNNMEYFGDKMKSQNKILQISACALKQNKYEIPDLVRFCNEKSYHLTLLSVYRAINVAMWNLTSEELTELKQYYKSQKFHTYNDTSKSNLNNYNDFVSNMDIWIADAKRKENFKEIFDLTTTEVPGLKKLIHENIGKEIFSQFGDDKNYQEIRDMLLCKFADILKSLPDYFESNHFYRLLNYVSPYIMVEHLAYCNTNTTLEILEELFYYCGFSH